MRFVLMALGMLALLGGLWAGLLRLGWAGPLLQRQLPAAHGPLMVCGFLGTLISLERAVAIDRTWAYLAPTLAGAGGFLTLIGIGGAVGPLLVTFGSAVLVAIFGFVLSIQTTAFAVVMGSGAVAWMGGNLLWLTGWPIYGLVPWWIGFLVLTIAGERLELSRMLFHAAWTKHLFLGLVGLLAVGLFLSLGARDLGFRVLGAGLVVLALWLTAYDVARRTVKGDGLTRFIAVCLLAGYFWLGVGGGLALLYGNVGGGFAYDATLHAVFVGFVFSMIFGHAPVIFPSVLGIPIPYRSRFYVHAGVLHGALFVRIAGDLMRIEPLRSAGGWGNAAAILLFLASTALGVARETDVGEPQAPTAPRPHVGRARTASSSTPTTEADTESIPDLDLHGADSSRPASST